MKKMLSLVGAVSISSTAVLGATNLITTNQTLLNNQVLSYNALNSTNPLKDSYESLTLAQQIEVSNEMELISELQPNQIALHLQNSKNAFLQQYQHEIVQMAELYQGMKTLHKSPELENLALTGINWSQINDLIDLKLTDSNEYTPWVDTYTPSSWWKVWEWGWQLNFPEGDINIMKIVNLGFSYFNGINFKKLERLIAGVRPVLTYIQHIDDHTTDRIQVLYDLIIQTQDSLKESGLPFTDQFFAIFEQFTKVMVPLVRRFPISFVIDVLKNAVKDQLGMSLEELGKTYIEKFNIFAEILPMVNVVLKLFKDTLPVIFVTTFLDSLKYLALDMVDADYYHNGVALRFQQFFIPMGFYAL